MASSLSRLLKILDRWYGVRGVGCVGSCSFDVVEGVEKLRTSVQHILRGASLRVMLAARQERGEHGGKKSLPREELSKQSL